MKIVCKRHDLLTAFQTAVLFVPGRNTPKDVLAYVRIEAQADGVTLQATDLDTGAIVRVEGVDVDQPGVALLPASHLGSLLRESTDERLRIQVTSQGAVVRGEHSELRLNTRDESEFPALGPFHEDKYHLIDGRVLRTVIQRTEFATDAESTRYALGGVLFELEPDTLIAVATDGRRLAKVEASATAVGGHAAGELSTIVRAASLRAIARALADGDEEVRMTVRSSDVVFQSPRATFFSRLVEGRFPRWRDVIPKRPDAARVELPVGPLSAAIRQAAVVLSGEYRGIDFQLGAGSLVLVAASSELGDARIELPVSYAGPPMAVMLDYRFVLEFLKVLPDESQVQMEVENAENAVLLTAEEGAYLYVVMPLSRDRAPGS
jgi:DNA polymerase-3 subunit beta